MQNVRTIGYWSATLSVFFAVAYSVSQLFSEFKLIPHPQDLIWLFLPSLFLAPAFLITMLCLHYSVHESVRIWTAIGLVFAILYSTCVTLVYFTQLTVVIPQLLNAEIDETHVLAFQHRSFLMAVDCLGYFFMSMSTLFAAFAFSKDESRKWLFRGLLYNGFLLPVLILAFFYPFFYYIGALWMITFPVAMIQAARLFQTNHQWKLHLKEGKYEIK